jgi:hypothetical protein
MHVFYELSLLFLYGNKIRRTYYVFCCKSISIWVKVKIGFTDVSSQFLWLSG